MKLLVKVGLPLNIERAAMKFFEPFTTYEVSPLKILNLKEVFVTFSGFVLDENGLIKECHHNYPQQYQGYLNEAAHFCKQANIDSENLIELDDDTTYLLIHHPWYNYYHWICEAILRLWMVKDKLDNLTLLLPEYYGQTDFIMGSLEPFGIRKIYFIPNGKSLIVKNLCMPQIKPLCDSYHIKELHEIRSFYLDYVIGIKKLNVNLGDRIYLSRKKANRKKVINEDEVEAILDQYDFKIVYNEDYSFLEQVSIYSNARYLVSIHGSGLTNMLFMKKGASILEIHKSKTNEFDHPSFVFWYQAEALGFDYYHQISEPITEEDDYFFGDFEINIKELENNLAMMFKNIPV